MNAPTVRQRLLTLPGVGVSLLPKLMCPACWPAYAAVLSSAGLGFLISTTYLFPLTVLFLMIAVGSLGFRASRPRGLWPLWMGVAAGVCILGGKFYLESPLVTDAGIGFLILASVWHSWPRSATVVGFCDGCVPAEDGITGTKSRKGELQ